jgi:hypothetical protein
VRRREGAVGINVTTVLSVKVANVQVAKYEAAFAVKGVKE